MITDNILKALRAGRLARGRSGSYVRMVSAYALGFTSSLTVNGRKWTREEARAECARIIEAHKQQKRGP